MRTHKYMPAHEKKGPYAFPVCGSSNAQVKYPVGATDMLFCLKLPKGLYYMSANSIYSGKNGLMCRQA